MFLFINILVPTFFIIYWANCKTNYLWWIKDPEGRSFTSASFNCSWKSSKKPINYQLSIINYQLSIINFPFSTIQRHYIGNIFLFPYSSMKKNWKLKIENEKLEVDSGKWKNEEVTLSPRSRRSVGKRECDDVCNKRICSYSR